MANGISRKIPGSKDGIRDIRESPSAHHRVSKGRSNDRVSTNISAFNENLGTALLSVLHEGEAVDGILGELGAKFVIEVLDLVLYVVAGDFAVALLVACGETSELVVEEFLVEDLGQSDTTSLRCLQNL